MSHTTQDRSTGTAVQEATVWIAGFYIALGVFGFVPRLTAATGSLEIAGPGSEALLLGLFQVSVLHNMIHLAFGAAGLAMAASTAGARRYLVVGGIVNLGLALHAWAVDATSAHNFVPLNDAAARLHAGLAVVMVALAIGAPGRRASGRADRNR